VVIDRMGRDLPRELWPKFADHIAALFQRAEQERQSAPA
jgi:hypothetical protein